MKRLTKPYVLLHTVLSLFIFIVSPLKGQANVYKSLHYMEKQQNQGLSNSKSLENAFMYYMKISKALAADNYNEAKIAGFAALNAMKGVAGGEKAANLAGNFTKAPTIEEHRKIFAELSDELVELAKHDHQTSDKLFLAHCPMANDSSGAHWLTDVKMIQNPYLGNKMLSCGKIKGKIE